MKDLNQYINENFYKNTQSDIVSLIDDWCKENLQTLGGYYEIDPDTHEINVHNSIAKIINYNIEEFPSYIQFGTVDSAFIVANCTKLKTMRGFPYKCSRLDCDNCASLKDCKYIPKIITGAISFYNCKSLTSLVGCPESISGVFDISNCESLKSLKGIPKKIGLDVNIYGTKFTKEDVKKESKVNCKAKKY